MAMAVGQNSEVYPEQKVMKKGRALSLMWLKAQFK
jgi:hypothetical protein